MSLKATPRYRPAAFVLLIITSFSLAFSRESSVASIGVSMIRTKSDPVSTATKPDAATILARFVEAETKAREALNQHTFKRDVVLQTIGREGQVTGEYVRNSQFLFDDQGRRIENVIYHPPSGIREMRITKEDIQDLAGAQLLGIDIVEATKYRLNYAGVEAIDSRQLYAIDVTPIQKPNPKKMRERFFVGRVWVDPDNFQIVKIKGIVEPQGKQRFPLFETWREVVNGSFAFPTRTVADDVLHFPDSDVHYRIKVNYYDYKLFASKLTITDVDDVSANDLPPTPKPKSGELEACVTNRNAPPVSPYHWSADAAVQVYLFRNMFTAEQRTALLESLKTWTTAGYEVNAGITFTFAGETDRLMNCRNCLTIRRREVYKNDGSHYSFFNPLSGEEGRVLTSAWIDLDYATTHPQAVQGFIAHELGHGMGLWDCETCKNKRTIMNGFRSINRDNGLIAPSRCDLETVKNVYAQERQVAASKSPILKPVELVQSTNSATAVPVRLTVGSTALEAPRTQADSSSQLRNFKF